MMSVVWQLPRDILHSIYSEWLEWEDLSCLDVACVEKNEREVWLTSLTDLRMSTAFAFNGSMRIFYEWLRSRNVFYVEAFPIRVDVLEDLVAVLDMESCCPTLRSIEIETWSNDRSVSYISHVKSNLSVILSHCGHLQGVTVWMSDSDGSCECLSDIVLSVLVEQLRENSLVKISLQNIEVHHEIDVIVATLLTKHASSLRDLNISTLDEEDLDFIVSALIKNQICLRVLSTSQAMPSLISYLSSTGGLLEVLEVSNTLESFDADDLVASVAASCPKLTRLVTCNCEPCSIETLRRLYEQCPHLQDVSIGDVDKVIETDEKTKSVSIEVQGHSEDWSICLYHVLRRRQYKKVTLRLREVDDYHPVRNLKSMLEPYHIHLDASTTVEISLISLLRDLPHVNSLHSVPKVDNEYTDATLAAISEHANSLIELTFDNTHFTNSMLSELIKTCHLLERLTIVDCGLECLKTISELSNLNMVDITLRGFAAREVLEGLLLDDKVTWPSTLKKGTIKAIGYRIPYKFDNKSHQWIR
eukprot:scaffold5931_cov173-Ochromonas_danica.AAC.2